MYTGCLFFPNNPITFPHTSATWSDYTGTLYVGLNNVNLRQDANPTSTVVAQVNFKTELTALRTNGIYYEVVNPFNAEAKCYILCDLVTSNISELNFSANDKLPVEITFAADYKANLRSLPFVYDDNSTSTSTTVFTYDSTKVTGTFTKVAVSANGWWYQLSFTGEAYGKTYENQTLYVKVIGATFNYTDKITDPSNPGSSGGQGGIG